MVSHLLPLADQSPRCAEFARDLRVAPAGSGLRLDRVVLVPVPEPWPKPALGHVVLKSGAQALAGTATPTRVLAAVPWDSGIQTIEIYELSARGTVRLRVEIGSGADQVGPERVTAILSDLARIPKGGLGELVGAGAVAEPVTDPVFAVCTDRTHDPCCGRFGTDLAAEIERRGGSALRRVSHIGGHRFAPTLIELGSARMWAYADWDLVERLTAGRPTGRDLAQRCRGWLGASPGPAQVAEIEARIAHGAPYDQVVVEAEAADSAERYRVTADGRVYQVDVAVARQVPAIKCEAAGGLPAKTAIEYRARIHEPELDALEVD